MSYVLTVVLVTIIAAAFNLPTYTYRQNLQAFVTTLLLYGWVRLTRAKTSTRTQISVHTYPYTRADRTCRRWCLRCYPVTVLADGTHSNTHTHTHAHRRTWVLRRFSKHVRSFSDVPQLPDRCHRFHLVTCDWLSGANKGNYATDMAKFGVQHVDLLNLPIANVALSFSLWSVSSFSHISVRLFPASLLPLSCVCLSQLGDHPPDVPAHVTV